MELKVTSCLKFQAIGGRSVAYLQDRKELNAKPIWCQLGRGVGSGEAGSLTLNYLAMPPPKKTKTSAFL